MTGSPGSRRQLDLGVLDALRGLAALYVMLGHARWLLWAGQKDFQASGERGIGAIVAVLSAGLTFGHQAVLLFFLLSGFCIHYRQAKVLARGASDSFDVRSYAWRRFRRLYPPLLVALALTGLFDYIGAVVNPAFYAGHSAYASINQNVANPDHSIPVLLGNLLLQASFAVQPFGTNQPLWSLAYEFWFYALYPALLALSARSGVRTMVGVVAAVSLVAFVFPHPAFLPAWIMSMFAYWIVWVVGAFIAEVYVGRLELRNLRWLTPAALLGVISLAGLEITRRATLSEASTSAFGDTTQDLIWATVLAILLANAMLAPPLRLSAAIESAAHRLAPLGDVSYTLYVVHFPTIALISAWWLSAHARLPFGAELAICGTCATLLVAWCAWYLVERRFSSRVLQHDQRARRDAPVTVGGLP